MQAAGLNGEKTSNTNQTIKEADDKRSHALVKAKTKSESIKADVQELDKVINETTDWKNATDIVVKKAMRNIEKWKDEMNKITEAKREFKIVVEMNQFTEDEDGVSLPHVEREVRELKEDLDAAILSIENEDNIP